MCNKGLRQSDCTSTIQGALNSCGGSLGAEQFVQFAAMARLSAFKFLSSPLRGDAVGDDVPLTLTDFLHLLTRYETASNQLLTHVLQALKYSSQGGK